MDRLAIELMEDSSIPGRVFFQLLSGIEYGHFSIQTLGSFCIAHGRYVVQHKYIPYRRLYVPFQCTLDCAETVTVKDITGNENAQFVPKYLKVKRVFNIKATHFPESLPIDLMSVDLVLGCYREKKDVIHHLRKEKFVFLFRTKVTWKKYEFISLPMDYSSSLYRLKEVLFDKLTLFSANVILPKIQSLKLQHPSSFEQDEAAAAVNAKNSAVGIAGAPPIQRPPHPVYKPTSIGDTSQSLSEKLQYIFLERSIAMDIFLFLMSLIIWLILYGDHVSVRHTILFIFLMMILIVNARTVISFLLQRNYGRNKKHVTSNGKSFFVNGWNAWSFCGSVRQGENPPIFAMPSLFVKAFHHGGVGTSLPINLGEGTIPISASYFTKNGKTFHQGRILEPIFTAKEWKVNKDYIASDMFTLLTDIQSQYGVVIGFLSQKQHFGCISTNLTYDRISVHVSGDGVLIRSGSSFTTDLLSIYAISSLEEPFSVYMSMSSEEHQVRSKLSEDIIAKFSIDMNEDLRKTVTFAPSTVNPSTPTKQPTNFKSISRLETEDDEDIFPAFAETLFPDSPSSATQKVPRVPVGWCSWYHYFRNINEENLSSNLLLMKEHQKKYHGDHHQHGLKLFQIDDGYQLHWGDWKEVHPSFSKSRSLTGIVQQIEIAGLLSGIWLAPFACDKGSNVAKSHPEWILRKKEIASYSASWIRMTISWIFYPVVYFLNSRPANSGNCGKFFYGLDITHPTFQKYLQDCFQVITKEWGFRYLKLDFLYSAILHGSQHSYYNRTLTKAQIMQLAMKVIYDGLNNPKNNNNKVLKSQQMLRGSKDEQQHADEEEQEEGEDEDETDQTEKGKYFLLGCGSALGSMIGHVHANRISPDAGLTWEAEIPFCRHDKWNLPSARTMIRNTINRLFLHNKWWINDPDCLLLRDELPFTEDEIIGITTVKAISGGSILISDDLAKISPKRMRLLQQLLPPTNIAAIAVDLMEKEMPECFRNIFVSNHCKRSLKQQRIRQLQKKQLVKAELLQQQQPIIGSAAAPYSPRATGNPNNHTADDATLTESLLSPFEAVLYSKRHPHSPSWSSRGSPLMTGMMMKSSMFDSLDFVEERAHQFANLALSYSDDEKDEEEKLQNDSFDDQLDEDHAIVQSVDGKIAKGTPITLEMRVQGIKEKWLDKRDLHKRWFVFTVCNWSDPIKDTEGSRTPITVKTQFISLKTIFTEPVLNEFIEYTRFLYDPTRKANKAAVRSYQGGSPTKRNSTSRHGGLISPSRRTLSSRQLFNNSAASLVGNPLAASPGDSFRGNLAMNAAIKEGKLIIKHILHLFNFWNQSYSYRIIDLLNSHEHENEEETNEIAFPDIPCHSAQIYSIHLSLHPLLPKYLGSNLHFSCGLEIRHCFMTETLSESQEVLQSFTEEYLKQRLETERELEEEKNTSNAAAAAAAAASTTSRNKKTVIGGISSVASASSSFGFTGETSFSSSRLSLNTSFSNNTTTPSAARYRSNRNKNMKPSAYPTLASSFSGSVTYNSFAPVVQTMCIAFEEGVLRDEAWNGYIWLYLPVNIKRAKIFYQLLGKVVVSGTAWNDTEEGLKVGGGVGGSIDEDRLKVIEYIEDTSSRAAGYVYRIKVASSKDNPKQQQNQLKKIEQALLDEEEGKSSPRRRSQRSGYISATSTIDEADSREERESASRDSFEAKKRSLPRKPLDLSNLMESKEEEEEKEGGAVAVQNEEVKSEEKKKEKEEAEVEGGESPHPSLSMSATLENIGMSGLVPTPLKLRFDQNDPGIILSRSESFMVMPQKQTPNSAIKAGLLAQSLAEGPMKVGNAAGEGLAANYASPSKPLKIASVANLHKLNDHIDYLLVSWISDMEERVARVDSPTKLFS